MNLEEKINQIGQILADVQLDISLLKQRVDKIHEFLTDPDKLNAERFVGALLKMKSKTPHKEMREG